MGLGRFGGGVDAVRYLARQGARICITDGASAEQLAKPLQALAGIDNLRFRLGGHEAADFEQADVILVNPAVPDTHPLVVHARRRGKTITTSVNLFFAACPASIIGITGANGKSTTTALTAHLLGSLPERRVWLSGNIGHHPLLESLDVISGGDQVVLELSSFQTERMAEITHGPQVALLTNLTPNHLDRHGTFEDYCAAKEVLFQCQPCQGDSPCLSLFCAADAVGNQWFERYRGQVGRRCMLYRAEDVPPALRQVFPLPGQANLTNLAGAWAIARAFGVTEAQACSRLASFRPLPHRLALVADREGIRWYNDSIATTPESTLVALAAFDQPKILIAGGYDKGVCFQTLGEAIRGHAKGVVLLGQTAQVLERCIQAGAGPPVPVTIAATLEQAVQAAKSMAQAGDVVLLSPACASYDMFTNFQERGDRFAELVDKWA
jgi:UDP-N-acetylmuramoylalanine--D-glutamate ligase